jgi:hypothetical protein
LKEMEEAIDPSFEFLFKISLLKIT